MDKYDRKQHGKYKTAAYRLFHFGYDCDVPHFYLLTEQQLTTTGYRTNTDGTPDALMREMKSVNIAPAFMAKILDQGGAVYIKSSEDAVLIYRDCIAHLNDWLHGLDNPVVRDRCPVKGLYLFDRLAEVLHEVCFFSPLDRGQVKTIRSLKQRGRLTVGKDTAHSGNHSALDIPPYAPIASRIEERMIRENLGGLGNSFKRGMRTNEDR